MTFTGFKTSPCLRTPQVSAAGLRFYTQLAPRNPFPGVDYWPHFDPRKHDGISSEKRPKKDVEHSGGQQSTKVRQGVTRPASRCFYHHEYEREKKGKSCLHWNLVPLMSVSAFLKMLSEGIMDVRDLWHILKLLYHLLLLYIQYYHFFVMDGRSRC